MKSCFIACMRVHIRKDSLMIVLSSAWEFLFLVTDGLNSSHKGPVMEKIFPCSGVTIFSCRKVNSLWPSDAIWPHRSGSTLAQVMAWCLMAPSHYLNQCCLISMVMCHSSEDSFTISHQSLKSVWKLLVSNFIKSFQGPRTWYDHVLVYMNHSHNSRYGALYMVIRSL